MVRLRCRLDSCEGDWGDGCYGRWGICLGSLVDMSLPCLPLYFWYIQHGPSEEAINYNPWFGRRNRDDNSNGQYVDVYAQRTYLVR